MTDNAWDINRGRPIKCLDFKRAKTVKEKQGDNAQTIRQQIIALLNDQDMNARELSQAIGIREKEVFEHLPFIARSVAARKKRLDF